MPPSRTAVVLLAGVLAAAQLRAGPVPSEVEWSSRSRVEGSAAARQSSRGAIPPALAQQSILAAEDSRIDLPDGLHTPAIDLQRAKLAEDFRILFQLTRSPDPETQNRAIRALGRYERREVITDLLRFLPTLQNRSETAQATAQAFKGEPLPTDGDEQQLQSAFEALVQAGRGRPRRLGWRNRSIDRTAAVREAGTGPGGRRLPPRHDSEVRSASESVRRSCRP